MTQDSLPDIMKDIAAVSAKTEAAKRVAEEQQRVAAAELLAAQQADSQKKIAFELTTNTRIREVIAPLFESLRAGLGGAEVAIGAASFQCEEHLPRGGRSSWNGISLIEFRFQRPTSSPREVCRLLVVRLDGPRKVALFADLALPGVKPGTFVKYGDLLDAEEVTPERMAAAVAIPMKALRDSLPKLG
jgi:hypothetical protein